MVTKNALKGQSAGDLGMKRRQAWGMNEKKAGIYRFDQLDGHPRRGRYDKVSIDVKVPTERKRESCNGMSEASPSSNHELRYISNRTTDLATGGKGGGAGELSRLKGSQNKVEHAVLPKPSLQSSTRDDRIAEQKEKKCLLKVAASHELRRKRTDREGLSRKLGKRS